MYFIRLQYGGIGGFRSKVMRLRERNKASVTTLRSLTLVVVMIFGILWLSMTVFTNVLDNTHMVQYAENQSKIMKEKVVNVKEIMYNINNREHIAYFTAEEINFPFFNVGDSVERSYLSENINRDRSNSVTNQISGFLRWYVVIGIVWWVISLILVAVHKSIYRKRMVSIS